MGAWVVDGADGTIEVADLIAAADSGSIGPVINKLLSPNELHTLLHHDLALLIVMVALPFVLRALWDELYKRMTAACTAVVAHCTTIAVRCTKIACPWLFQCGEKFCRSYRELVEEDDASKDDGGKVKAADGLCLDYVLQTRISWADACKMARLQPNTSARVVGLLRLVLWHWLQPLAYFFAVLAYVDELTGLQLWLAAIVAVREVIYVVLCVVCLAVNPAYLLVDTAETWRLRYAPTALAFSLLFVLSPEKFVWLALVAGLSNEKEVDSWASDAGSALEEGGGALKKSDDSPAPAPAPAPGPSAEPNLWKRDGTEEELAIKRSASIRQIELEKQQEIRTRESRVAELKRGLTFDRRGKLILAFGAFLVVLDMSGLVAIVVALLPDKPAPPALLLGYSLTAIGGGFVLACAFGFYLVQALRRCGVLVPEWLVEVETQMRLFLVMMGAAQPRDAAEEAAVEEEAAAVEGAAEDPKLSQLKEGELQKELEAVRADAAAQGEAVRAQQTESAAMAMAERARAERAGAEMARLQAVERRRPFWSLRSKRGGGEGGAAGERERERERGAAVEKEAAPVEKEAVWLDAFQNEFTKEESHRELTIAVAALANSVSAAVKSCLGDFESLWGIVDDLQAIVLNMSWGSMETAERNAAIAFDQAYGRIAVLVLEGQSSSTDVRTLFGGKVHTVKLKVRFKRMQAGNEAALEICQSLMNEQAADLVGAYERTRLGLV